MVKLIYCLKIYIFRSQFVLTGCELEGLILAPLNDLDLLKQLKAYGTNQSVAKAALKSFSDHLWYLSETLIGLSFFDSKVSDDIKVAMVAALERSGLDEPLRRIDIDDNLVSQMQLSDFVTRNTKILFDAFDITKDFLHFHPSTWEKHDDFLAARRIIRELKVVNDAAERG